MPFTLSFSLHVVIPDIPKFIKILLYCKNGLLTVIVSVDVPATLSEKDLILYPLVAYHSPVFIFCPCPWFDVVLDVSKFTRFKQDFLSDLQSRFDCLVDLTEPICQKLDPSLADM